VAVPLMVRGHVVGVLEALNKKDNAHYTEEDLTLLETLGALAAQAMENVDLARKVRVAKIELAELERLKTDFIAITSHELRTPLGLILGHATFLRELAAEQFGDQLDTIIRNATKLKEIVESLSNVDNYQNGSARVHGNKVSMSRIAEDVIASFRPEAEHRNITLRTEWGDLPYYFHADQGKITIALSNLVKNAIQFTESGGHVKVKIEEDSGYIKDPRPRPPARVRTLLSGGDPPDASLWWHGIGTLRSQGDGRTAWRPYLGREHRARKHIHLPSAHAACGQYGLTR
jgi:signal transduction histidine kinase